MEDAAGRDSGLSAMLSAMHPECTTRRTGLVAGLLLAALGTLTHAGGAGQVSRPPSTSRVLFIGNSLTAANDLPGIVSDLARVRGRVMEVEAVTFNNFSLEDHWRQGAARDAIARGGWTTVVLQQGPSALTESRELLVEYTRRFDEEIRRVGATTALYMVWPARARSGDFSAVSASYAAAARRVDGLLLPAGDAWRAAWRLDSTLPLYGPDDFHPSPLGSYLAGLVIYASLTGESPIGLPAAAVAVEPGEPAKPLDDAVVDALQRAASSVLPRGTATRLVFPLTVS